jgi:ESF2/ABP1 family protein
MSDKVAGKKRAASSEPEIDHRFDGIADFDQEETEAGPSTSAPKSKSTSTKSKSTSKKRKTLIPGIVYISRLPPGMTPQKVKYLMAQWGDVGKIYAQKKDGKLLSRICIYEMEVDSSSDWI